MNRRMFLAALASIGVGGAVAPRPRELVLASTSTDPNLYRTILIAPGVANNHLLIERDGEVWYLDAHRAWVHPDGRLEAERYQTAPSVASSKVKTDVVPNADGGFAMYTTFFTAWKVRKLDAGGNTIGEISSDAPFGVA